MGFGVDRTAATMLAAPGGLRWLLVETDRKKCCERMLTRFSVQVRRADSDHLVSWSRYNMGFWDFCLGWRSVSLVFPSLPPLSSGCPSFPLENLNTGIDRVSPEPTPLFAMDVADSYFSLFMAPRRDWPSAPPLYTPGFWDSVGSGKWLRMVSRGFASFRFVA